MALPTHYTGSDGEVQIGGNPISLVNFNLDVTVGVINSPRIGKISDMHYSGKKEISGTITQVVVSPELMQKLLGPGVTSSAEALLTATNLSGAREEIAITSDPTGSAAVSVVLTVGDDASTAGSMVIHGLDSSGAYATEVLDFTAMATTDVPQVVTGTQMFSETNFVDVEAALDGYSAVHSTVTINSRAGIMTITPGPSTLFNIIGKVEDTATGASYQVTANNCFFTAGSLPISDSETIVQTDLPFVMRDADSDLTIAGSTT